MDRRDFLTHFNKSALITLGFAGHIVMLPSGKVYAEGNRERTGRLKKAYRLREKLAREQRKMRLQEQPVNGDEERYEALIANFSKGLPHNKYGEVELKAYRQLLHALETGRQTDFDMIPMGGPVRLANPQAARVMSASGAIPISQPGYYRQSIHRTVSRWAILMTTGAGYSR